MALSTEKQLQQLRERRDALNQKIRQAEAAMAKKDPCPASEANEGHWARGIAKT